MRTVQLVLAAFVTAYASPAFAGAVLYQFGDDSDAPLPRVIYGVRPAPTPVYPVDHGPSFDAPVTGYAAPRVYGTEEDEYPYVGPRVYVGPPLAGDPYVGGDDYGYLVGPRTGSVYGGFAPYRAARRHQYRHHRIDRGHNGPVRIHSGTGEPRSIGQRELTGSGGAPHLTSPGSLAGAPTARR